MNRFLIILSRILIACLIIFELLNAFKILHFSLTFTWLGLILTGSIAWFLIETISWINRKKCGRPIYGVGMLIATTVLYFDAAGDIFLLFSKFSWYDQAIHFLSGAATTGIVYSLVKGLDDCSIIKVGTFGEAFFSWLSAIALSVIYEIEEYSEDILTGSHRLGDRFDTVNDLLMGMLGALTIATIIYIYVSQKEKTLIKNRGSGSI